MDLVAVAYDNFGLRINTEKTVVMHEPSHNTLYTVAHINVNGAQLKPVDTFTYLGSNLSRSTKVDDEIAHQIAKASQAFGSASPPLMDALPLVITGHDLSSKVLHNITLQC
ncbi:unnamed protein product [Schistocephalus solidus]|uniref:Reverse transcriptase domain-containing protein n=1 Tax=Schistocephalus solidus TaxID=70667 RepID=A0A183TKP3_SCHSO|nr:unnamed protein product [Schistocephalus solidus]